MVSWKGECPNVAAPLPTPEMVSLRVLRASCVTGYLETLMTLGLGRFITTSMIGRNSLEPAKT